MTKIINAAGREIDFDAACLPVELEIWNAMTPMQRTEVLQKVPYVNSMNKRFKMCLSYIKANVEQYRQGVTDAGAIP